MKKLHKILLGVFGAGILLMGIGTGVLFTEITSLAYEGEQILGETEMQTGNFDVEFEPEEQRTLITGWYNWDRAEILTDARIPENTIRFCVTYNGKRVQPDVWWEKGGREEYSQIIFGRQWIAEEDDLELMMKAKDLFLENLKAGRIVSFDTKEIEKVTVLVNPANEDDVQFMY